MLEYVQWLKEIHKSKKLLTYESETLVKTDQLTLCTRLDIFGSAGNQLGKKLCVVLLWLWLGNLPQDLQNEKYNHYVVGNEK